RRDAARRRLSSVRRGRVRADRTERRRQDDVSQRAQRLRPAGCGQRAGLRRGPAADRRLPPRALGAAADVPAGAGDRAPVGVRQRRPRAGALRRPSRLAATRRRARARVHRARAACRATGRQAERAPPEARGGRPRGCRQSARRAPRRAGGGPPGRGDRASRPSHPQDSGCVRRARRPRRPRHEPRLGLLSHDRRPRLRQGDRVGPDGGRAPERACFARLPRDGDSAVTATAPTPAAGASGTSALRIEKLDVWRGGRRVLREVSLEIPPGEVTTLLGPNGAGKSTLVLAVAGVLRSRAGAIRLGDEELTRRRPEQIRATGVAVVPEGRRLLPELTVEDNLRVATYALPRHQAREGVAHALELFPELEKRWKVVSRSLSGGEQQMVVLAQALVSKPQVLLVDELSLGLAPVVVKRLV